MPGSAHLLATMPQTTPCLGAPKGQLSMPGPCLSRCCCRCWHTAGAARPRCATTGVGAVQFLSMWPVLPPANTVFQVFAAQLGCLGAGNPRAIVGTLQPTQLPPRQCTAVQPACIHSANVFTVWVLQDHVKCCLARGATKVCGASGGRCGILNQFACRRCPGFACTHRAAGLLPLPLPSVPRC